MGQKLKVPILFVYVMKEKNLHYHLYARKVEAEDGNAKSILAHYVESISWILQKYPYQWFNYFDFWDVEKKWYRFKDKYNRIAGKFCKVIFDLGVYEFMGL